ncbi:MAG: hypothetical protein AB7O26_17080 [Planctomycetaceae bacterium]
MQGARCCCRRALFFGLASLVFLMMPGCRSVWPRLFPQVLPLQLQREPEFRKVYGELEAKAKAKAPTSRGELRLSIAAEKMPLTGFLRWISQEAEISVIASADLDGRSVTLDVTEELVDDVLSVVARRLGVQITRTGKLYFLGTLRPEDLGVMVRRVKRLTKGEIEAAVAVLLSEFGQSEAFEDGLVVVGDRVEVLQRVEELLSGVETAESVTWLVQLHLVSLGASDLADLGLDVAPAVDMAYTFSGASASIPGAIKGIEESAKLKGSLNGVLRAAAARDSVHIVAEPLVVIVDGSKAEVSRGEKVPVARRAISDEGTVTTQGFDYIATGLQLVVGVRDLSESAARMSVDLKMSKIERFVGVDQAPATSEESFKGVADVVSGGVYLLGSLERSEEKQSWKGGLQIGRKRERESRLLQIWARTYRVGMPPGGMQGARSEAAPEAERRAPVEAKRPEVVP